MLFGRLFLPLISAVVLVVTSIYTSNLLSSGGMFKEETDYSVPWAPTAANYLETMPELNFDSYQILEDIAVKTRLAGDWARKQTTSMISALTSIYYRKEVKKEDDSFASNLMLPVTYFFKSFAFASILIVMQFGVRSLIHSNLKDIEKRYIYSPLNDLRILFETSPLIAFIYCISSACLLGVLKMYEVHWKFLSLLETNLRTLLLDKQAIISGTMIAFTSLSINHLHLIHQQISEGCASLSVLLWSRHFDNEMAGKKQPRKADTDEGNRPDFHESIEIDEVCYTIKQKTHGQEILSSVSCIEAEVQEFHDDTVHEESYKVLLKEISSDAHSSSSLDDINLFDDRINGSKDLSFTESNLEYQTEITQANIITHLNVPDEILTSLDELVDSAEQTDPTEPTTMVGNDFLESRETGMEWNSSDMQASQESVLLNNEEETFTDDGGHSSSDFSVMDKIQESEADASLVCGSVTSNSAISIISRSSNSPSAGLTLLDDSANQTLKPSITMISREGMKPIVSSLPAKDFMRDVLNRDGRTYEIESSSELSDASSISSKYPASLISFPTIDMQD